jgi:hypothetical protein
MQDGSVPEGRVGGAVVYDGFAVHVQAAARDDVLEDFDLSRAIEGSLGIGDAQKSCSAGSVGRKFSEHDVVCIYRLSGSLGG